MQLTTYLFRLAGVFRLTLVFPLTGICLLAAAVPALSAPMYQPNGANLTYGDVRHPRSLLASPSNPAAGVANLDADTERKRRGAFAAGVLGLEYGDVGNLFDTIDDLAESFAPSDTARFAELGVSLQNIDIANPDLRGLLETALVQVGVQETLADVIESEGYGRLFVAADVPYSVGTELLGGAWNFDFNYSAVSTVFSVAQPIEAFDVDAALAELQNGFNLTPGDAPELFELTGGVNLRIDPSDGSVALTLENDTFLLTKAGEVTTFSGGYSRTVKTSDAGRLHVGGKVQIYRVGLVRVGARFGDLTDSEELFDAIRDARFKYSMGLGLDVGALWVSDNYQLGATLTNINEPSFNYTEISTADLTDQTITNFIEPDRTYKMERQLKLEASAFTSDHKWSVNMAVDTNAIKDPVGFEHQWFTLSGGVETGKWWLPSVRVGYRKNLAGTELDYLSLGVTLLKLVNLDVASTLDTVEIDDMTLPRGVMASIGFEVAF